MAAGARPRATCTPFHTRGGGLETVGVAADAHAGGRRRAQRGHRRRHRLREEAWVPPAVSVRRRHHPHPTPCCAALEKTQGACPRVPAGLPPPRAPTCGEQQLTSSASSPGSSATAAMASCWEGRWVDRQWAGWGCARAQQCRSLNAACQALDHAAAGVLQPSAARPHRQGLAAAQQHALAVLQGPADPPVFGV